MFCGKEQLGGDHHETIMSYTPGQGPLPGESRGTRRERTNSFIKVTVALGLTERLLAAMTPEVSKPGLLTGRKAMQVGGAKGLL